MINVTMPSGHMHALPRRLSHDKDAVTIADLQHRTRAKRETLLAGAAWRTAVNNSAKAGYGDLSILSLRQRVVFVFLPKRRSLSETASLCISSWAEYTSIIGCVRASARNCLNWPP
jgi:hypothetical protein